MFYFRNVSFALAILMILGLAIAPQSIEALTLDLDFNSGLDDIGNSTGNLLFNGPGGFQVTFTDDESSGGTGGNANGVHINNINHGNIKVGSSTDFVLGAFNNNDCGIFVNCHTSGIVANFRQGVTLVRFFDSDDDLTTKTLFAFDQFGGLIGQTQANSQKTFEISLTSESPAAGPLGTGGQLIHSIEFDTQAGTAGGAADGTFFTIDDFHVEYDAIPEPSSLVLFALGVLGLSGYAYRQRRKLTS